MISYYRSRGGRSFYEFLMELPEGQRFLAAANPPRGACAADVRALSENSFLLRYSDIQGMAHYAQLSSCLAGALRWKDADHQDAKVGAWIQQATVFRILGRFREAKEVFSKTARELSKGGRSPHLQALLWEKRAALFRDLGQFAIAEHCLEIAASHHLRADQSYGSNGCLISLAICAGYGGKPRKAVRLAEKALQKLNPREQPDLAVGAIIALCWNLVDCGDPVQARACYVEGESQFDSQKGDLIQAHRLWLRAHIDDAVSLYPSAAFLYKSASEIFRRQSLTFNRALVLLDLCGSLSAQRKKKEAATVAIEILPEFVGLGLHSESEKARRYVTAAP